MRLSSRSVFSAEADAGLIETFLKGQRRVGAVRRYPNMRSNRVTP